MGIDLLKLDGEYYLVVTDYFSHYLEIVKLNLLTSKTINGKLKKYIQIASDNGGQFTSTYFREFVKTNMDSHVQQ